MKSFICSYCGNTESKYIGFLNGNPYCRKCVQFRGEQVKSATHSKRIDGTLFLEYGLSEKQRNISQKIVEAFKDRKDSLVYAVCGAGKTELVFDVIKYALDNRLQVGFAIPRRDVVIELATRLKETFRNARIVDLYGGNTQNQEGDIIILTTHQLYRYESFFDLMIIDEVDAFPFKDNEILNVFFKKSVKGNVVVLTATPSVDLKNQFKGKNKVMFELLVRYHNHPIPVPRIKIKIGVLKLVFLVQVLRRYVKEKKPCLVFVPTTDKCVNIWRILDIFVKNGGCVSSKTSNRKEQIEKFREGRLNYLVTTSVLERGITVENLQVIILDSDSYIFTSEALVQISGRAGRKANHPDGEVYFLANKRTKEQSEAINEIKRANTFL